MTDIDKFTQELLIHLQCDDYKLFYIHSTDELKAIEILGKVTDEMNLNLYTFDLCDGLRSYGFQDKRLRLISDESLRDCFFVLKWIEKNVRGIVVFLEPLPSFEANPRLLRAFKNLVNNIIVKKLLLKVVIISSNILIPNELQLESFYMDFPLPERDEVEEILNRFLEVAGFRLKASLQEQFISSLQGLRESDIINVLKYCLSDGELNREDLNSITQIKKQLIRKESLLEFILTNEKMKDIGGMKNLKEWLNRKKVIFENIKSARDFGVDIPKGILLFGMPGCGKSLVAKVLGNSWQLPLLRLDMGMILGPYVGQSEENIRKAIKITESIAPCVLWIDELEKGFSGIQGDGGSSDVMRRVFGSFLTWLQEKTKPVFVVATANDISGMPPEFMRKGRFDEIFFVDFPKLEPLKEIIRIHLKKRKKEDWFEAIVDYATKMEGFSGADVEAVIAELVERAFVAEANHEYFELRRELEKILGEFKPISISLRKKIDEIKAKLSEIDAKNVD